MRVRTPETPVQLHQILAIIVLDVEEREALEDDTDHRDEETQAGDRQVSEAKSSNLLPVMSRIGLTLGHALSRSLRPIDLVHISSWSQL